MYRVCLLLSSIKSVFRDILLIPVDFDSVSKITMTWTNENVHRQLAEEFGLDLVRRA